MPARSKRNLKVQSLLEERAAAFRGNPTVSEAALWRELRSQRLGVAFRRQYVVGRFVADFAAPACRLIIEVDGGYHERRSVADARRDRYLSRLGYRVLHLDAAIVSRHLPRALALVGEAITLARRPVR